MKRYLKYIAAIGFTALKMGVGVMALTPAEAAASLLQQCRGVNRGSVEHCCMTWTKQHGRPIWMQESYQSCAGSVTCTGTGISSPLRTSAVGGGKKMKCFINFRPKDTRGSPNNPPPSSSNPNRVPGKP